LQRPFGLKIFNEIKSTPIHLNEIQRGSKQWELWSGGKNREKEKVRNVWVLFSENTYRQKKENHRETGSTKRVSSSYLSHTDQITYSKPLMSVA